MTANTPNRAYTYPSSTDHTRLWEHLQELATDIDTDVNSLTSAWTAYTPAWTSSGTAPAIGNGSIAGRYKRVGKLCTVAFKALFGSTTTYGTGAYSFSLPVAALSTSSIDRAGSAYLRDMSGAGAGHYMGLALVPAGQSVINLVDPIAHAQVTNTVPFTWANTDFIEASVTYETA